MLTVLENSSDAIAVQDLNGRFLVWNRGAERMYGWSEAEALQMTADDLVPAAEREATHRLFDAVRSGQAPPSQELKRLTRDGRVLDVWVTATLLTDANNRPVAVATTERDITARKRTEAELRRFATVLRDSNDAITMQDLEGTILAWNRGAERMYGWSEAEALGMNVENLAPEPERTQTRGFLQAIRRGEEIPSLEVRRVTRDGRVLDVWLTITRLVDDKGRPVAVATTERDITARKQAAQERERLLQDLHEALQVRDEFLAIASHELKNPLSALGLKLELLRNQARGDGPARALQSGLESAAQTLGRLTRLVDELLDVSRITAGRLRIELEPVDLSALVGDVVDRLREFIERSRAPFSLRIQPSVELSCDRLRIEQVIVNLITNAIKHGRGAPIEVELCADPSTATLVVRDRGPGIPESEQARIFERFSHLAPRGAGGLGLGLYIARQIVEAHGGRIELKSRPGAGATFRVVLPRGPPALDGQRLSRRVAHDFAAANRSALSLALRWPGQVRASRARAAGARAALREDIGSARDRT